MFRRVAKGFSLIELMVVVAIIAILASLAYYSYSRYAFRVRRADGREMLMRVAAAQERFFTNYNRYATTPTAITDAAPNGLGFLSDQSEKGYYTIQVAVGPSGDVQSYLLAAAPRDAQADDLCINLRINSLGLKNATGTEDNGACW
jgi:type IV pilus assembly protein PilE